MAKIGAGGRSTTARSERRRVPLLRLISVLAIVSTLSIHRQFYYATSTADFEKDPCGETKERVFRILKEATQSVVNNECSASRWFALTSTVHVYGKTTCDIGDICDQIPAWSQVMHLYGDEPIVIGMEGCANYRKQLRGRQVAVRVAGLYNSGTHALISSLEDNLPHLNSGPVSDVPWGKHVRISHREKKLFPKNDTETPLDTVLPVVVVRDPYRWMTSMCKTSYDALWPRARDKHCPNLVRGNRGSNQTYRITVRPEQTGYRVKDDYQSLVDMWIDWHQDYLNADFPRLLIRFEDFLFHRAHVLAQIEQCATGDTAKSDTTERLDYRISKAKKHGRSSDLVSAIIKYGSAEGRLGGMTADDLKYANESLLQSTMFQRFGYRQEAL